MASGADNYQGFLSESSAVLGFCLFAFVRWKYIFQDFMETPLIETTETFHFPVKNLTLLAGENIIET